MTKSDFKYEDSLFSSGRIGSKFKVVVVSSDHNETIDDDNKTPKLQHVSPKRNNRGLHISGIRADGRGGILVDIAIPPSVPGDFKLPKSGETVWCEQAESGDSRRVTYLYADYSSGHEGPEEGNTPPPLWGSMNGDYGHLRSLLDHNMQFAPRITAHKMKTVPKEPASFRTKWVRSIAGERWRDFYKGNVKDGFFVNRGDNVFDIDPPNMILETVEEDGLRYMLPKTKQWEYPEPNNAPEVREKDNKFKYIYIKHQFVKEVPKQDVHKESAFTQPEDEVNTVVHKVKNFYAYEPILDKTYKKKTKGFERELVAVKEYNLTFRGNNKLLFQDIHGDGEQLLLTLKNQYDAGFTIVHDGERGQVRIRDHLGNTILLDSNPDRPRIITTTKDKRVFEIGDIKGKGGFVYMRNGGGFGNAHVPWGRKTNKTKEDVFNQEFVMVDSVSVIQDEEFIGRLSSSFAHQLKGPGIYHRTSDDENKLYEKRYSSYELAGILVENSIQLLVPSQTSVVTQSTVVEGVPEWFSEGRVGGIPINLMKHNIKEMKLLRPLEESRVTLGLSGISVESLLPINIKSETLVNIEGAVVNIKAGVLAAEEGIPVVKPDIDAGVWIL